MADPDDPWNDRRNEVILSVFSQDANGSDVYNNDRAQFGFLETAKFMSLPYRTEENFMNDGDKLRIRGMTNVVDTLGQVNGAEAITSTYVPQGIMRYEELSDEQTLMALKTYLMNYERMRNANYTPNVAHLIAGYRSRWFALGGCHIAMADNSKRISEYAFADHQNGVETAVREATTIDGAFRAMQGRALEAYRQYADERTGIRMIVQTADVIWCAVEHAVRIRGHHFKEHESESYKDLYERYVSANFEGESPLAEDFPWAEIARTAIHPFGLFALPRLAAKFLHYGTVGNAAHIRFAGAPNGTAVVTTTSACIKTMRTEVWYKAFEQAYGDQIELLHAYAEEILENKYRYHMSAALYGCTKKTEFELDGRTVTIDEMKSLAAAMSGFALGYVNAISDAIADQETLKFSFSNQKVFKKHASNSPVQSVRVAELVNYSLRLIGDAESLDDAITNSFPELRSNRRAKPPELAD